MKTEIIKLGEREITFTVLPATARTLKFISPILQKKADGGANIAAILEAIQVSLSYTYSDSEIDDILDLIPIDGDAGMLKTISGVIFRDLK